MRTGNQMQAVYEQQIGHPDAAEALNWLQEADDPELRSISGSDGSDTAWFGEQAITIVNELYRLGAVKVTVIEIEGRVEQAESQDTSTLIIELPDDAVNRACLFAWNIGFARGTGWDPVLDQGQKYMLIKRD